MNPYFCAGVSVQELGCFPHALILLWTWKTQKQRFTSWMNSLDFFQFLDIIIFSSNLKLCSIILFSKRYYWHQDTFHNRKSIDYVRFSMQCSSSQRVRLPFTFMSTHYHSEFREFSMITGMAPDSSLIKIFSRTNWRTLMVWFWEPHPSTSHRTHIRLGLTWHFNFRQRDFEFFFRKSFKLESLILVSERGRKLGWLGISHHGNSRIKPQLCHGHPASA